MNNQEIAKHLHDILDKWDNEFLCHEPECMMKSDHQFAHDKAGRLPVEFRNFITMVYLDGIADGKAMVLKEIS